MVVSSHTTIHSYSNTYTLIISIVVWSVVQEITKILLPHTNSLELRRKYITYSEMPTFISNIADITYRLSMQIASYDMILEGDRNLSPRNTRSSFINKYTFESYSLQLFNKSYHFRYTTSIKIINHKSTSTSSHLECSPTYSIVVSWSCYNHICY